MPSYKLCYFNSRGLGEMCRLMFAEAGVTYEDVRFSADEWPKHKPDMLFNAMPVLFVDGEQIAHSRAALRYLAREFKLDGGDSLTAAKFDMWIEVLIESIWQLPMTEPDEKIRAEKSAKVWKETLFPRLAKFDAAIKGDYFFGDNVTALDIAAYSIIDELNSRKGDDELLNELPKIKAMMEAVEARPNVAKWLAERPKLKIN